MRGGIQILSGEKELLQQREQELQKELDKVRTRIRTLEKDGGSQL
jgi:prefoldin subunit 5